MLTGSIHILITVGEHHRRKCRGCENVRDIGGECGAAYLNYPDVLLIVDPNGNDVPSSWPYRLPSAIKFLFQTARLDTANTLLDSS
jgi:hypothetical protein